MSSLPVFSFQSEDFDFNLKNTDSIQNWLADIAAQEKKTVGLIEYIFCSDDFLLDINKTHLNHDFLTDIITFPLQDEPIEANIFISIERVVENAQLYKQSFEDELHRVMAHGLLHLLSYNDKTDDEKAIMRQKENECLEMRTFM